jgi:hypothetical protein
VALSAALTVSGITVMPGRAAAKAEASQDEPREVVSVSFDLTQIRASTRLLTSGSTVSSVAKASATTHLKAQARSARLVDATAVRVAELPNPFHAGETLTVVSDGPQDPTHIDYVEAKQGDDDVISAGGFQTAETAAADVTGSVRLGGGFLGATNHANMTTDYGGKINEGCSTFTFGSRKHKMTSCYQKFRKTGSKTREYIYNRWMLFTVGSAGDFPNVHYLRDLTIRSRQQKGQNNLERMTGWLPTSGSDSCSDSGKLSLSIGVASMEAPIRKCSSHTVLNDSNMPTGLMGLDWTGRSLDKQHRLDASGAYVARNGTTIPVFADYNWATTQWCSSFITCDPGEDFVQKDGGWS